jgi:hypothetical protein
MESEPPRPDDPPAKLYERALALHAKCEEQAAVIERIKAYIRPMETDKRMRIFGGMLLREIERAQKEEAERTRQGRERR